MGKRTGKGREGKWKEMGERKWAKSKRMRKNTGGMEVSEVKGNISL